MHASRPIFVLLSAPFVAMLLLAGCPPRDKAADAERAAAPANGTGGAVELDADAQAYAALLEDPVSREAELKRLQRLYSEPADISNAAPGHNDALYTLSSITQGGRVGIVVTERDGTERWTLWFWDSPQGQDGLTVTRDEATSGGYSFEADAGDGLTLAVSARWVQGRYLQLTRELLLTGVDRTMEAPAGSTVWTLDGPWLPYRCVPSTLGPYGVVADREFGKWISWDTYPVTAILPALALYDRLHGAMIMSVDDHARLLTRSYDLRWLVPAEYEDGVQAQLGYHSTDMLLGPVENETILAGEPRRDTIIFEPFNVGVASIDSTLVEAETRFVIRLMSQAVRAYHFVPKPPEQLPAGANVPLSQWLAHGQGAEDFMREASGIWGGTVSLDGAPDDLIDAAHERQFVILEPDELGDSITKLTTAADVVGAMAKSTELAETLAKDGFVLWYLQSEGSNLGLNYIFGMGLAEALHQRTRPLLLGNAEMPSLAAPVFSDTQLNNLINLMAMVPEHTDPNADPLDLSQRYSNHVIDEIFGVAPRNTVSKLSLAQAVLSTTQPCAGHDITPDMRQYAGFDAYATHQRELRESGGELRVLYSDPEKCAYTVSGERPAVVTELVATLPAIWDGAATIWIAFHGCTGSVVTDYENNITVSWNTASGAAQPNAGANEAAEGATGQSTSRTGETSWHGKLPPGIWVIEHPSPEAVQPGDVVLLKRTYVSKTELPEPDET